MKIQEKIKRKQKELEEMKRDLNKIEKCKHQFQVMDYDDRDDDATLICIKCGLKKYITSKTQDFLEWNIKESEKDIKKLKSKL